MMNEFLFEKANLYASNSIESIVTEILPAGKKNGQEYIALNPTRADHNLGSFTINLRTGKWADFATGDKGGDIISLYAYIHGISQCDAAKEILGDDIKNVISLSSKRSKTIKVNTNNKYAKPLWNDCHIAGNSLVKTYLTGRSIDCEIPSTIRFNPSLYHKETNSNFPAMVAAVTVWPHSEVMALHRTYLSADGSSKADIEPNKKMLGSIIGGAVRLSSLGNKLVLAEGIETALSVYQSTGLPTWATLSTSGMINVQVPSSDITPEITIAADNDVAGVEAANRLSDRLLAMGYIVRMSLPPEGMDFNDVLRG